MRTFLRSAWFPGVFLLLSCLIMSRAAEAMCVPCPCQECGISSGGQLNWVVLDRERERITLIPNIRIAGTGKDFALLLPTPTIPEVQPASRSIWNEAFGLTAPAYISKDTGSNLSCGCSNTYAPTAASPGSGEGDGIDIIRTTTVGAFIITTIQATDPAALKTWLNQNGFQLAAADVEKLRPFTDRGWSFCAMQVDTAAVQLTPSWDLNVDPIAFTFEATRLEVPLSLLGINRISSFPMAFFIVDDHRMNLTGFQTTYANHLSVLESAAISARYPNIGAYLPPGKFLTRLEHIFTSNDPMESSLILGRADKDSEYRRVISWQGWLLGEPAPWLALAILAIRGLGGRRFQRIIRRKA